MIEKVTLSVRFHDTEVYKYQNITFSQLNVIVGHNNVGKSLIFKSLFCATFVMNYYKALVSVGALTENPIDIDKEIKIAAQKIFNMTFQDPEEITRLKVKIKEENSKYTYKIHFRDGHLKNIAFDIQDKMEFLMNSITPIKYASVSTRTWKPYASFLKIKRKLGIPILKTLEDIEQVFDLLEFPLYDLMWLETMQHLLYNYEKNGIPEEVKETILTFFMIENLDPGPKSVVDLKVVDLMPVVVLNDGHEKKITSLSSGYQAITTLLLGAQNG